jgi:WD40 repeat protein
MIQWLNAWRRYNGGRGAAASLSYAVLLVMASTGYSQEKVFSLGEGTLTSVVWSPNGELVAASSHGFRGNAKKIVVAEVKTEKIVREFTDGPFSYFHALAFTKDSKAVYSFLTRKGDDEGAMITDVQCWNIETGKEGIAVNLPGYGKFLSERFLVTAISPKQEKVNVFDFVANKPLISVKLESRLAYTVISKDGKYLATVEKAGPVNVWDLGTGGVVCTLKFRAYTVQKVFFLPKNLPSLRFAQGRASTRFPPEKKLAILTTWAQRQSQPTAICLPAKVHLRNTTLRKNGQNILSMG